MKTLALRRDAMSHTSYKLFIFPLCCRAGSCSELCCHRRAAGLFEILDDAVHFHVAHLSAVMEWWRMGGGDRGFKRQRSALLQTTGTCKGPPSIMTAPRCQSATLSLPFSATCDQQSCQPDSRQACHSGWRLQIYACWHMCLKGCFYSGSVWSKQASAGSFLVGPFFY